MITSEALRAPTSPPDTGASSDPTRLVAAASWISTASAGSLVVMSISSDSDSITSRIPCSPSTVSRTSTG